NLSGFDVKAQAALRLAEELGDARNPRPFAQANWDYTHVKGLGDCRATIKTARTERFVETPQETKVLYSFTIHFEPNVSKFDEEHYGPDFQRALEQASLFGNAVISIRGHADPYVVEEGFEKLAKERGVLKERQGKFYLRDGSEIDLSDMHKIVEVIDKEKLGD